MADQPCLIEHDVALACGFVVEQFQIQPPAGGLVKGMDEPFEPLGVLAAPDPDFVAVGQQVQADAIAAPSCNQEGEVSTGFGSELRRDGAVGSLVSFVGVITRQESSDVAGNRLLAFVALMPTMVCDRLAFRKPSSPSPKRARACSPK